jgi:hypothetical protein
MKWIIETIGIVLCIQGVGGAVNSILDGGRSWFLLRYVVPEGAQVPVGIVLAALGAVILLANARNKQDA